jgi:hypothetical protein
MEFNENKAEMEFKNWLDKHNIAYWYIQQDIDTFSKELKNRFTKRPDFLILIPNFGFILVDVKDKKTAEKYEKFFINVEEVEKYINLQRTFNLQSWYVISNEKYHFKTWFWIPITKVIKSGFIFETKEKKDKCYSVPLDEFVQVSDDDSLERVFVKLLQNP